jgi:acetylornithine deacetylase
MQQQILAHLGELIRCDTQNPPRSIGRDHPIFKYINSVLGAAGDFSINLIDHGEGRISYLAMRGQPRLLFNVHLDTVPVGSGWTRPPLEVTIADNRAYGRGTADIKGAAAVLLAIAAQSNEPVALLFTTDEEGANGCCVRQFTESLQTGKYEMVIVAEPTLCRAILGHRGYLSVLGEFSGEPGHSSDPRALGDNAIHKACTWAVAAIDHATDESGKGNDLCFNIGTISGGSGSNVIAAETRVHWSARISPGSDSDAALASICNLTLPSSQIEWNARFNGPALPAFGSNDKAARDFCEQHDLTVGEPVDFWTEASLFSAVGQPTIVLGPGDIKQAHTADEWVELEQLNLAADIYQRLLQET